MKAALELTFDLLSDVHSESSADLDERIADLDLVIRRNDSACYQCDDEA